MYKENRVNGIVVYYNRIFDVNLYNKAKTCPWVMKLNVTDGSIPWQLKEIVFTCVM